MKKITIAVDGPAAAGKSTIAKRVAKELEYIYIDTGAMYRSVAYHMIANGIDIDNEAAVGGEICNLSIELKIDGSIYLNGEDVSNKIRTSEISKYASKVAAYGKVREYLVKLQRNIAANGGVILDGRDIGTVVLPDAELKIFQIASVETRALRRHLENVERGIESSLEEIKNEIINRDYNDMNREISPLKKADDAIEIDTSDRSIEEVVEIILELVKKRSVN